MSTELQVAVTSMNINDGHEPTCASSEQARELMLLASRVHDLWESQEARPVFESLMKRLDKPLRREIGRFERDPNLAEEALQETWFQAWWQLSPQQAARRQQTARLRRQPEETPAEVEERVAAAKLIQNPLAYFRKVAKTVAIHRWSPEITVDLTDETKAVDDNGLAPGNGSRHARWLQWFSFVSDLAQSFGVAEPPFAINDIVSMTTSDRSNENQFAVVVLNCAGMKPADIVRHADELNLAISAPRISQIKSDAKHFMTRDFEMLRWAGDEDRPPLHRALATRTLVANGWTLNKIARGIHSDETSQNQLTSDLSRWLDDLANSSGTS